MDQVIAKCNVGLQALMFPVLEIKTGRKETKFTLCMQAGSCGVLDRVQEKGFLACGMPEEERRHRGERCTVHLPFVQ